MLNVCADTGAQFCPKTGEIFEKKIPQLDRYASSVSADQGNPAESLRKLRHNLRNTAGRILGRDSRVAKCGKVRTSQSVDLYRSRVGASYTGLSTCGSVWNCPVCASKIAEGRKDEVEAACKRHKNQGGEIYMGTFTVPHTAFSNCQKLRDGVANAWRRVLSGRGWKRITEVYGISAYIKGLEVTVGANGWHPHLHVLFFLNSEISPSVKRFLENELFERWALAVEKEGLGQCSKGAFDLVKSKDGPEAAHYVAKWGAGSEITKGSSKKASGGNCAPWELLERAGSGDKKAVKLFAEYAAAFYGARQLTWSKGLKARFDIHEVADEMMAQKEMEQAQMPLPEVNLPEGQIGIFCKASWDRIVKEKLTGDVLDLAHFKGWAGVSEFLESKGIKNELADYKFSQSPINDTRARAARVREKIEGNRKDNSDFCAAIRDAAPKNRLQRIANKFFNFSRT